MLMTMHYMRDGKVRLNSLLTNIGRERSRAERTETEIAEHTIREFKNNFYSLTTDMMNAITEILLTLRDTSTTFLTIRKTTDIQSAIREAHSILKQATLDELTSAIQNILAQYRSEDGDFFRHTSLDLVEHLYKLVVLQSNSRDLNYETYRCMMDAIVDPERKINILDAAGRNAPNFLSISDSVKHRRLNATNYAFNVKEANFPSYKASGFDRIALGGIKGGTFSNEVFDIMLLSPQIELYKRSEMMLEKNERTLLKESFKFLRPGGVLFLTIPAYRFYKDMCVLLAKGYTNIQIRKSPDYDISKMLYIIGVRRTKEEAKETDEATYSLFRTIYQNQDIETVHEKAFDPVFIPEREEEVKFFRGSVLNTDELGDILSRSSCMKGFFNSQQFTYAHEQRREPLLPFTTGQIGLVLTSGSLDGVIDEGDGHYHVVKGRVVKTKQSERNEDRENREVAYTETIANRVEINVMTADGTLRRLA